MSKDKELVLPKTMSCRLGDDDMDIKTDLAKVIDKSARIKEIYRLGLQFEASKVAQYEFDSYAINKESVTLVPADEYTRKLFESEEAKRWYKQAGIPSPTLYIK